LAAGAAAQDVSGLRTADLQQRAQQGIERQAFAGVVAELAELDRRYRESDDPAIAEARENVLYYLGLARLQGSDFSGAETVLRELLATYPAARKDVQFYSHGWSLPVRTQEAILRSAGFPERNVEAKGNYWGQKPPL
jgi:hypothetical protein